MTIKLSKGNITVEFNPFKGIIVTVDGKQVSAVESEKMFNGYGLSLFKTPFVSSKSLKRVGFKNCK